MNRRAFDFVAIKYEALTHWAQITVWPAGVVHLSEGLRQLFRRILRLEILPSTLKRPLASSSEQASPNGGAGSVTMPVHNQNPGERSVA